MVSEKELTPLISWPSTTLATPIFNRACSCLAALRWRHHSISSDLPCFCYIKQCCRYLRQFVPE